MKPYREGNRGNVVGQFGDDHRIRGMPLKRYAWEDEKDEDEDPDKEK